MAREARGPGANPSCERRDARAPGGRGSGPGRGPTRGLLVRSRAADLSKASEGET